MLLHSVTDISTISGTLNRKVIRAKLLGERRGAGEGEREGGGERERERERERGREGENMLTCTYENITG